MGPGGPLVRFDQSPSLFFLWPNKGGGSGDCRWRLAAPRGPPRVGMDPQDWAGPPGGRWVGGDGVGCRRRASRWRRLREQSGFGATVVPDQNQAGGRAHGRKRELLVERVERGRLWWCRSGRGSGGGRSRRRGRRRLPWSCYCYGWVGEGVREAARGLDELGASFYSATRSVLRRWG